MSEKDTIRLLLEMGVIEETDEPINVMLVPLTDRDGTFPGPPRDDLEAFYRQSAQDPFWAALGHAIQAYSRLEQSLCRLFEEATGMIDECAGIIFYKIINASTMHEILEKLAKRKYGEMHFPFWRSLIVMLRKVTQERNTIVHWRAGIHPYEKEIRLTLPRLRRLEDIGVNDYLNTSHLVEFIAKCAFIQTQVYDFLMMQDEFWKCRLKPDILTAWQERFQREVVYMAPSGIPPVGATGKHSDPLPSPPE